MNPYAVNYFQFSVDAMAPAGSRGQARYAAWADRERLVAEARAARRAARYQRKDEARPRALRARPRPRTGLA